MRRAELLEGRWTLDFGAGGHRAYITPVAGDQAPYRMTVVHPVGAETVKVGIETAELAVEKAVATMRSRGATVPLGVQSEWYEFARDIDRTAEAVTA